MAPMYLATIVKRNPLAGHPCLTPLWEHHRLALALLQKTFGDARTAGVLLVGGYARIGGPETSRWIFLGVLI